VFSPLDMYIQNRVVLISPFRMPYPGVPLRPHAWLKAEGRGLIVCDLECGVPKRHYAWILYKNVRKFLMCLVQRSPKNIP